MSFHVYILQCSDGSYYTGHTEDLESRLVQHQRGLISGYTSNRRPLKLVYSNEFSERVDALEMERRVRGWSRAKKEALISGDWDEVQRLAKGGRPTLRRSQGLTSSPGDPSTGSGRTEEVGRSIHADRIRKLFSRAVEGDRRALARLFSRIERDESELREAMRLAYPRAGNATVIGVTGPPGAGKSTLVDRITRQARAEDKTVGVLAVDPTSPFTGGAVLGDRIRMQSHYLDSGVFIRSLATRGVHGGLANVSRAGIKLLDAVGKDVILIETVGVGQTELDIMGVADIVLVVLVPEAGDTVQAMKAGLLEIADIFIVNKADRDGAGQLASAIRSMISLDPGPKKWAPKVLLTQAHLGEGVPELHAETFARLEAMRESGRLTERRSKQARIEVERLVTSAVNEVIRRVMTDDGKLSDLMLQVDHGETDPYTAAREILSNGRIHKTLKGLS